MASRRRNKKVAQQILRSTPVPDEHQLIARVIAMRGNHVMELEWPTEKVFVSTPFGAGEVDMKNPSGPLTRRVAPQREKRKAGGEGKKETAQSKVVAAAAAASEEDGEAGVVPSRAADDIVPVLLPWGTAYCHSNSVQPRLCPLLARLPPRFRGLAWLRRGSTVIVEPDASDGRESKVQWTIAHVLLQDHVKHLRKLRVWPPKFEKLISAAASSAPSPSSSSAGALHRNANHQCLSDTSSDEGPSDCSSSEEEED